MRKVKSAWYMDVFPTLIVIVTDTDEIKKFNMTPFRHVTESELSGYMGHPLSVCKKSAVPDYLYNSYGLTKI